VQSGILIAIAWSSGASLAWVLHLEDAKVFCVLVRFSSSIRKDKDNELRLPYFLRFVVNREKMETAMNHPQ